MLGHRLFLFGERRVWVCVIERTTIPFLPSPQTASPFLILSIKETLAPFTPPSTLPPLPCTSASQGKPRPAPCSRPCASSGWRRAPATPPEACCTLLMCVCICVCGRVGQTTFPGQGTLCGAEQTTHRMCCFVSTTDGSLSVGMVRWGLPSSKAPLSISPPSSPTNPPAPLLPPPTSAREQRARESRLDWAGTTTVLRQCTHHTDTYSVAPFPSRPCPCAAAPPHSDPPCCVAFPLCPLLAGGASAACSSGRTPERVYMCMCV